MDKKQEISRLHTEITTALSTPPSRDLSGKKSDLIKQFDHVANNIRSFYALGYELGSSNLLETMHQFEELATKNGHGYAAPTISLLLTCRLKPRRIGFDVSTFAQAPYPPLIA